MLVALAVRAASPLVKAGWHRDDGIVGWALWFSESLMNQARGLLFPLYSSLFTRPWLRLAGIQIGKRTEISTAVGLNRLTRFGEGSFATDDVVLATAKARGGWLHLAPVEVGHRSFLGNGAILEAATRLGDDSLVGVLTTAPATSADRTSWFGSPALELPRIADPCDPARTCDPPGRLIIARAMVELIRIVLPATVSTILAGLVFLGLSAIGTTAGLWAMMLAAPLMLVGAGVAATLITVADADRTLPGWRAPALLALRLARRDRQRVPGAARRRVAAARRGRDADPVWLLALDGREGWTRRLV